MAVPMPEFTGKSTTQQKIDDAFPLDDETQYAAPSMDPLSLGREEPELPNVSIRRGGIQFPFRIAPSNSPMIYILMSQAMAKVKAVGKTGVNQQQGYNFRGIDAVMNALGPAMRECGIVPVPKVKKVNYRDTMTTGGKPTREVTVEVRYRFFAPDGSYVDAHVIGESLDQSDKGSAKAMSVAYRIALLQVFALPTDEPDPDASYHTRDGVGSMAPSVAKLINESLESDGTAPDAIASLWPIVLEHSAAEREAYDNLTWANLFGAAFARRIERVETWTEGKEVMEAINSAGVGRVLSHDGKEIATLLRERAAFLRTRSEETFNHCMQHITGAETVDELLTARGCAEAAHETQILGEEQLANLLAVASERLPKLEREMHQAAPEPSGAPEVSQDEADKDFRDQLKRDADAAETIEDVIDMITNGKETRLFVATDADDFAIVRRAAYRLHAEAFINGVQRGALEEQIRQAMEAQGLAYEGYDLP